MTIVTVLQFAANPHRAVSPSFAPQSPLEVIGLVWIAASVGEEVLMRGLFQSSLAGLAHHRVRLLRRWQLSLPVALSGVGFGVIHVVVLWSRIGAASLSLGAFATVLGFIVGYKRERTGSLLPAILIRTLFDIGASLPGWILVALFAH